MTSRPTSFVDDANAVESMRSKIAAKVRSLPRVDQNGRQITDTDSTKLVVPNN
jgi:hypothetical protein